MTEEIREEEPISPYTEEEWRHYVLWLLCTIAQRVNPHITSRDDVTISDIKTKTIPFTPLYTEARE